MSLLVVGGHTRNIGKTALVVDIIRAFPEAAWTAVKLTQHGHGFCSINGRECDCQPENHPFALDEEQDRAGRTDTSRFLEAGAERSIWARAKLGCLGDFVPRLMAELRGAPNVIIESNSLLEFVEPDLYLMVLDSGKADFKDSARKFVSRADAFVLRAPLAGAPWLRSEDGTPLVALRDLEARPQFEQWLGEKLPAELIEFIQHRFLAAAHLTEGRSANS